MDIYQIFCIILIGVVILLGIVFAFINKKYTKLLKNMNEREVDDVITKKGVTNSSCYISKGIETQYLLAEF